MNRLAIFLSLILLTPLFFLAPEAQAGECLVETATINSWRGTITTGARVRSVSCMEESTVLGTIPVGTTVNVLGNAHGFWYLEMPDGTRGWVGEWLVSVDYGTTGPAPTKIQDPNSNDGSIEDTGSVTDATPTATSSASLIERLRGHILLQVEDHGEAWYVHPTEDKRYYMKDGPTAYEMMRKFGLGITNADLAKLQSLDYNLLAQLRGRIVLQVENHGEAFYIHPTKNLVTYLKNGPAAYSIMREQSLGITNSDLERISSREFTAITYTDSDTGSVTDTTPTSSTIDLGDVHAATTPSNIDLDYINTYWLNRVNALRAQKGLRQLIVDDRWIDTATRYAEYMGTTGATAHERADGSSMHDWVDTQGLEFTVRYSDGGWDGNYFTENISWGNTDNSNEGLIRVLEDTIGFYLREESYNGPHYRTVYHEDWNSVGSGFYFEDKGNGTYKVSAVFHYGSLQM